MDYFKHYNDLDKGTFLAAKQLLLLAAIAKAVGATADVECAETAACAADDARAMLRKLALQAEQRAARERDRGGR